MRSMVGAVGLGLVLLVGTPGCVFQEIRDEIKTTNENLSVVQLQLKQVEATNEKLDRLYTLMQGLDQRMVAIDEQLRATQAKLDATQGKLDTTVERLGVTNDALGPLPPIDVSLKDIDAHLASLRVSIAKINDTLPFFDIGGPSPTTQPTTPLGVEGGGGGTTRPRYRLVPATEPAR